MAYPLKSVTVILFLTLFPVWILYQVPGNESLLFGIYIVNYDFYIMHLLFTFSISDTILQNWLPVSTVQKSENATSLIETNLTRMKKKDNGNPDCKIKKVLFSY